MLASSLVDIGAAGCFGWEGVVRRGDRRRAGDSTRSSRRFPLLARRSDARGAR